MKIVKILGGLGNQMFQYALYVALKQTFTDEKLLIDTSCFHGYALHYGFELNRIFGIQAPQANRKEIMKLAYYYPNYQCWRIGSRILPIRKTMCMEAKDSTYDSSVLLKPGNRYLDGYWQNEKYFAHFRNEILETFKFPVFSEDQNIELIKQIQNKKSLSLHVRRGDYVNHRLYKGICTIEYYQEAIKKIIEIAHPEVICIFSNDIIWCEENLRPLIDGQVVYVDWNKGNMSYRDMQLMSCCNYNIIANSSFSWWGAWLNTNADKIVVAPKKWNNMPESKFELPHSWITLG